MPPASDSTREALLDAAREFAQTRGYNAFSFRDLAERVSVTTASIHYHFPTKADLGRELVIRYRQDLQAAVRQIEARTSDPVERLDRFCGILRNSLKKGTKMCLCGMFGAEYATLPGPVQSEVRELFSACEGWLGALLDSGRVAGAFTFTGDSTRLAQTIFASLQGGMLAACAFEDESRFNGVSDSILAAVGVTKFRVQSSDS